MLEALVAVVNLDSNRDSKKIYRWLCDLLVQKAVQSYK